MCRRGQVFSSPRQLRTSGNPRQDSTTAYDILGWDSVAHLNLMFSIEEHFGVMFSGNELAEFKNIDELKQFLTRNGC
ncbi:MAG TPA: acyl carrier protein [Candidatus Binatia bacterium]|nr:acyl carrier protein [Candidatus Binatia bacterium]